MEASRRDATDDWMLPEDARPPSVKELEARIDVATARARSAEAAASAIGSAALDAAEQARRSAEAAERTHKLVDERLGLQEGRALPAAAPPPVSNGPAAMKSARWGMAGETFEQDPMRAFIARADRISLRLQKLQNAPP